MRPREHQHGEEHGRDGGPDADGVEVAVDPDPLGDVLLIADGAVDEMAADVVDGLAGVVLDVTVGGVAADDGVKDGVGDEVRQAEDNEANAEAVTLDAVHGGRITDVVQSRRLDPVTRLSGRGKAIVGVSIVCVVKAVLSITQRMTPFHEFLD
jgi:hypothetical protein